MEVKQHCKTVNPTGTDAVAGAGIVAVADGHPHSLGGRREDDEGRRKA